MIVEYHRPQSIREALILLAREQPETHPLGGGTFLNRGMDANIAVVDLQALGLSTFSKEGNFLRVGAMVTLQELLDFTGLPDDVYRAIEHDATYNLKILLAPVSQVIFTVWLAAGVNGSPEVGVSM